MCTKPVETLTFSIVLAVSLAGCATPGSQPPPASAPDIAPVADLEYTVRPGDQLSTIARDLTGSLDNWTRIARRNRIDDPTQLRVGQTLTISHRLINSGDVADERPAGTTDQPASSAAPAGLASSDRNTLTDRPAAPAGNTGNAPADSPAGHAVTATTVAPDTNGQPVDTSALINSGPDLPVPVSLPMPDTDVTEVTLSAVARQPDRFDIQRQSPRDDKGQATSRRRIEVSGSYYPRGIYAEPHGSARLLMRATPGTRLPLERTFHNWYRVTTSQGAGYIRANDARIIRTGAQPGPTASGE